MIAIFPRHVRRAAAPILEHKRLLALSVVTLVFSAISIGASLPVLSMVFSLMLKEKKALAETITQTIHGRFTEHHWSVAGHQWSFDFAPAGQWLIDHLPLNYIPADQF